MSCHRWQEAESEQSALAGLEESEHPRCEPAGATQKGMVGGSWRLEMVLRYHQQESGTSVIKLQGNEFYQEPVRVEEDPSPR